MVNVHQRDVVMTPHASDQQTCHAKLVWVGSWSLNMVTAQSRDTLTLSQHLVTHAQSSN